MNSTLPSPTDVIDGYTANHAPRYGFLLALLAELRVSARSRLLDIGPSQLTQLIRKRLGANVDSLGYLRENPTGETHHVHFDLDLAQEESTWPRNLESNDYGLYFDAHYGRHGPEGRRNRWLASSGISPIASCRQVCKKTSHWSCQKHRYEAVSSSPAYSPPGHKAATSILHFRLTPSTSAANHAYDYSGS